MQRGEHLHSRCQWLICIVRVYAIDRYIEVGICMYMYVGVGVGRLHVR